MSFAKKFRKIDGEYVDIVKHTLGILTKDPTVRISIGTDSQNSKRRTFYATVIAYRYKNKGVHIIYNKVKVPKIKNTFQRLFKEVELSLETAQWFSSQINVNVTIELDYNGNKEYRESHVVIPAAKGWAESLGFKTKVKPEIMPAVYAADFLVR